MIILFHQNQGRTESKETPEVSRSYLICEAWTWRALGSRFQVCYLLVVCDLVPQFLHLDCKAGG